MYFSNVCWILTALMLLDIRRVQRKKNNSRNELGVNYRQTCWTGLFHYHCISAKQKIIYVKVQTVLFTLVFNMHGSQAGHVIFGEFVCAGVKLNSSIKYLSDTHFTFMTLQCNTSPSSAESWEGSTLTEWSISPPWCSSGTWLLPSGVSGWKRRPLTQLKTL